MDNVYEISMLLDFYGQLLTERQYEILDLHYNNDYSLGEIAQQLSISRQGVFDNIKRAKASLDGLEQKLGLVKKFTGQKLKTEAVLKSLKDIDIERLNEDDKKSIRKIQEDLVEIINDI